MLTRVHTDRPETQPPESRRVLVGLALPGRGEPGAGDASLAELAELRQQRSAFTNRRGLGFALRKHLREARAGLGLRGKRDRRRHR